MPLPAHKSWCRKRKEKKKKELARAPDSNNDVTTNIFDILEANIRANVTNQEVVFLDFF